MLPLTTDKLFELEIKANEARQLLITTLLEAKSGHSAGPLGMADVFTAFYFHILNHDPKNPNWEDRDRLILSNGHICPIRYVSMAQAGYFPQLELKSLRKVDSRLQGHPHRTALPGLETTSGPLGEGLSQAIGIALAAKMDKKNYRTYVIMGDGEQNEGNIWEAAMLAGKIKLDNLIAVIDRNKIQIDGNTEDIMPLEPLKNKYESFNWHVIEADGNNIKEFIEKVEEGKNVKNKPVLILSHITPGKGVSYMENNYKWHGVPPDTQDMDGAPPKGEQGVAALNELRKIQEQIKEKYEA